MGLDMYLSVKRSFTSDAADLILKAAGTTLADLKVMAAADPYESETEIYLPLWEHYGESPARRMAEDVLTAADMLHLVTPESPSGALRYEEGNVVVMAHCFYWRKANAIHAWFVRECQDGVDECQESEVSVEQIAQLVTHCRSALEAYHADDIDTAQSIMSPQSGFFFGGTDMDEWWAKDMETTIEGLEKVVRDVISSGGGSLVYRSSW